MSYLKRADIEIMREAGRNESGLPVFTLHRRLSLGPAQLAMFVRSLAKKGMVTVTDDLSRVQLTEAGFEVLAAMRQRENSNSAPPAKAEWIYRPKLGLNFPYLPRRSKM